MKNIVITGSTRGIGLAMAQAFLKAGCNVTLSGRYEANPQLMDELKAYSTKIQYVSCNVQDPVQLERLWDQAIKQWGSIDCWINNAGQNAPHKMAHETDFKDTHAVIATNLTGMIYGSQIAARNMIKQGHGQIWNMEGLGSNNMIQVKTILYGTTKHALTYFTKGLAKELQGTPVLIGRLSPGMMLTDFITKGPDGQTSDVLQNKNFQFIFNNLGDHPETVAEFFIPRILNNTKNDAHLVWLSNMKAGWRLLSSPLKKRKLI
ncbi:MAG: short-chain dehydrogenase [Erysipelotrichaceae bacterium]|nr:MAG: short-chain dehydrogenase [Erysipelotrichaceae bacterium]